MKAISYFSPINVILINDYCPFGVQLDGRHDGTGYRYGLNGMEKDDEIKGQGNSYDFGARMYDPRIGRWFSRDKFEKKYNSFSTYSYAVNSPLLFVDKDGNDIWIFHEDGTWEYKKTEKLKQDNLHQIGGDKFYFVHDDGTVEDMLSTSNWVLGSIPGVDVPYQDINQEFNSRAHAWALYSKLNPKDAKMFDVIGFLSGLETVANIVDAFVGVVAISEAAYSGGKIIYTLIKAGKSYENVVQVGKSLKIGNITYKTGKAFADVSAKELDFLSYADKLGTKITVLERQTGNGVKTADFVIKGAKWELKTIEDIVSKDVVRAIKDRICDAGKQSKNVIADMRNLENATEEVAVQAAKNAFKQSKRLKQIRIIGDGYDKVIKR